MRCHALAGSFGADVLEPFIILRPFAERGSYLVLLNFELLHQRTRLIAPETFTATSFAPGGTSVVVVFPPGQRTQICVGG
jgi:hypothetical protein